jgi:lysophospholipase L1-like esterase
MTPLRERNFMTQSLTRVAALLFAGLLPLVALGSCGGNGGRTTAATPPPEPVNFGENDPVRVTAIGDSITEGTDGGGTPYPARLQGLLRGRNPAARVNNRGQGGQTTPNGLSTVSHALATDRPGFLLIMEGTNDVRTGLSLTAAAGNLREMVRRAKANFTVPILATVPPQIGESSRFQDGTIALNVMIRQIATEERVTLAEVFTTFTDPSFLQSDGLHPTDRGNQTIAIVFDGALTKAGYPTGQVARRRR